ncbi:Hypothetical protein SRAE_2000146800 [Strongyloides ratti]|uniref:Uncharacterized protein n=1 Tax=Strongyloides ratti TaxID=34506 RepID=A0A090LAM8_STRRB|nr:Hypothetical protein SRAE_2000146800 [Strongyloides ratti]CEF66802.1 Hypothetical protein SRAE_2000146800 [Strongyloides ratti]
MLPSKGEDNDHILLNKKMLFNGITTKNSYVRKFEPYFNSRTDALTKNTQIGKLNKYDPYFLLAEISRQNNLLRNKSKYSRKHYFITN